MAKTLDTANSAVTMSARGFITAPFSFQGYSTDDSFTVDDVASVETRMGVDGRLSGGFTPQPTVITFMLEATSPTIDALDSCIANQKARNSSLVFDGTMFLQGTQEKYAMVNGYLTSYTPANKAAKTLQPRKFTFTFEKFDKAPI